MNKKLLLLVLMLILCLSVTFIGCKKKAPEGFRQEFYDDIVKTSNDFIDEVKNINKEEALKDTLIHFDSFAKFCEKYYNDYDNGKLSITEEIAFNALTSVVLYVGTDLQLYYKEGYQLFSKMTLDEIEKLSNILGIEIKIDDININN